MNTPSSIRVVVGMSGGVDSSVSALLLREQGYDVRGVFMKNWEETDPEFPCTAAEDAKYAVDVCERLGIELDAVDFAQEYWDRVFTLFLEEYRAGRTPNPDILCNKEIKFRAFLDYALSQGADCIATGHYARVDQTAGRFRLLKGLDAAKDQTYFLYTLGQRELSRTIFPVGNLHKPEVRARAAAAGLPNAQKKDSTGICFIGERNFTRFLSHYLPARPGEIRTAEGTLVGTHQGLMYYTLGQRKGIGIGGRRDADEAPWYVVDKDVASNTLIIAQGDHPLLYRPSLVANQLHWTSGRAPTAPLRLHAKTRYRQVDQDCVLTQVGNDEATVVFERPQRAITPGQSVVFYQGDECIGGGIIVQAVH